MEGTSGKHVGHHCRVTARTYFNLRASILGDLAALHLGIDIVRWSLIGSLRAVVMRSVLYTFRGRSNRDLADFNSDGSRTTFPAFRPLLHVDVYRLCPTSC